MVLALVEIFPLIQRRETECASARHRGSGPVRFLQELPHQRQIPTPSRCPVRRTCPFPGGPASDTVVRTAETEITQLFPLPISRCSLLGSSRPRVTIPCLSAKDSSYMGKRLEQQPMYPQYTYYYPHYLQTKVCRSSALPLISQVYSSTPLVLPPSLTASSPIPHLLSSTTLLSYPSHP